MSGPLSIRIAFLEDRGEGMDITSHHFGIALGKDRG